MTREIRYVVKPNGDDLVDFLPLIEFAKEKGLNLKRGLGGYLTSDDVVIVFGGDGTLLGALRDIEEIGICPLIVGVHIGTLGFKMPFSMDNYLETLEKHLADDVFSYEMNPHPRLTPVQLIRANEEDVEDYTVMNDAVIKNGEIARVVDLDVEFVDAWRNSNGMSTTYRADGLIVSSTFGSTAYNLSAGGPIVLGGIDARMVTPIAPIGLTHKPIVIPLHHEVRVSIAKDNGPVYLTLDGQVNVKVEMGDVVIVGGQVPGHAIRMLRPSGFSEYKRISEKLGWCE